MKIALIISVFFCFSCFGNFDETLIQAPFFESNEESLHSVICRTREHLFWDICSNMYENKVEKEKNFSFENTGPNKIVPKTGFGISRYFEFMFEGFARSDLGILVWDMPDENESHGHLKLMMFFPRDILPAIRHEIQSGNDILIVTLPTKEEIYFNAKTKEIIGGVLKESPISQDRSGSAVNPAISYQGSGVVLEADRLNDYPVGFDNLGKNNLATISKKGHKDCKIPVNELWYTDNSKGGNVFFNKKYISDEAFDKFIQKKCGISIY